LDILVTGATGCRGSALCARLEAEGHRVTRLHSRNADLRQAGSLSAFDATAYEQVIHLAAWTQAGDFCLYHPGEQWIINQQINTNVLAWWQSRQPQARLISIGTSCAYAPDMPLVEENYLVGMPIASLFTYAMTKRMLYAGQLAMQQQYGLRHLTLVPSTLYGPGYHTDGRQMHFIFDLIRKIIRGKLYGETVSLWGDGNQRRELIYVDDFVNVLQQLMGQDYDLINVGAGEDHTIREFAAIICDQVGYPPEQIEYDLSRYVGARSKRLDVTRLRGRLPELKLTPLAEGLARTIDWFWSEQKAILAR
jgi:GDP-L-fucose synthase